MKKEESAKFVPFNNFLPKPLLLKTGNYYSEKEVTEAAIKYSRQFKKPEPVSGDVEQTIKKIATTFFYDWYNSRGSNTEQGFDSWWKDNKSKFSLSQQPLTIPWMSDVSLGTFINDWLWSSDKRVTVDSPWGREYKKDAQNMLSDLQSELQKRVNAVDPVIFKDWCDKLTPFDRKDCYDYYSSTVSYVIKSNQELLQIYLSEKQK